MMMIPVCTPTISEAEKKYVLECLDTNWISSKGRFVEEFENRFAEYCGCKYGISTTNGTTALHLAIASIGIKKGDEVIMPAFTIISTALAVIYCGAKPVFVDCDPETWNMDVSQIRAKITKNTKAILPVHIYGHPCDMDPILEIASEYNLSVIEDAAEVHGAEYKGRKVGGIGDIGCFSFYANKIITCGEGGMLITDDDAIAKKAHSLRDLAFPQNGGREYIHDAIGYNYRMTNIQAAIGLAQFEKIDYFVDQRRKHAFKYMDLLKNIESIQLPVEKIWAKNVYWMFSILIKDTFPISRNELMKKLADNGIDSRKFFVPMNKQPVLAKIGIVSEKESYPISEIISQQGLYLPSISNLTDKDIEYVCKVIKEIAYS